MTRDRMSRPSSSVPNQCSAEGRMRRRGRSMCAGSNGAISGAKIAKTMNKETRNMPIVASGLLRAAERRFVVFVLSDAKDLLLAEITSTPQEQRSFAALRITEKHHALILG